LRGTTIFSFFFLKKEKRNKATIKMLGNSTK